MQARSRLFPEECFLEHADASCSWNSVNVLSSPFLISLRASSPGTLAARWEMEEELATASLELNLNSTSNSPVVPRRLSCQISDNQHSAETRANVNKHWKIRSNGNDVITNVISANQHIASTFSMQIFKFQRRNCKLSFLLPERPGELARRLLLNDSKRPNNSWCRLYFHFPPSSSECSHNSTSKLILGPHRSRQMGASVLDSIFPWCQHPLLPAASEADHVFSFLSMISLLPLPLPFYITLVLQEHLPLLRCDPLQLFFWGFSAMSQQQSRSLET